MEEVWLPMYGYEGTYEISNLGSVRSVTRIIDKNGIVQCRTGKEKKQWPNSDGYPTVKLCKNGMSRNVTTHILVAKTFLGDYSDCYEVNHIDYDKTNNSVGNLEWVTHRDNVSHSAKVGHYHKPIGEANPNYGNHKLHDRFKNEPGLSQIQSRPGDSNGRAVAIDITDQNGKIISFGYIRECAHWLIDNGYTTNQLNTVAVAISRHIKNSQPYLGFKINYKQ